MICLLIVSQSFFPAMTKIVGTLGPRSRSVEIISGCLKAGMSGKLILAGFLFRICLFPRYYIRVPVCFAGNSLDWRNH